MTELVLVEENSESCQTTVDVETSTGGKTSIPMWVLALIGVTMIVGLVYFDKGKKSGVLNNGR